MPQRLNWTNRKRIERSHVGISILKSNGGASFSAQISLADYQLPAECRVVVEAYRQTTWRRYDFGTVGFIRPATDCRLDAFGDPDGVQFRLKVLSGSRDDGRIWAEADNVPVTSPDESDAGRRSLLNTKGEDLGEAVWRLDFEYDKTRPTLLVNNRLGDWRQVVLTVSFRSLVYPELLRRILTSATSESVPVDGSWQADWMAFAARLPGMAECPESEDADMLDEWVSDAVDAFCRQQRFAERLATTMRNGTDS